MDALLDVVLGALRRTVDLLLLVRLWSRTAYAWLQSVLLRCFYGMSTMLGTMEFEFIVIGLVAIQVRWL